MNFMSWKPVSVVCLALLVVSTHAQTDVGQPTRAGSPRTCERLRQDISLLFEQIYEKTPSLLNIMMDAAQDPNARTRVDFGADVLKKMIVNAFTSFLPICAHPQARHEQADLAKVTIPAWYFTGPHRPLGIPFRFYPKSGSQKNYREALPAKLRRRRSSSSGENQLSNELITIPVDLFQQDTGGEEEQNQSQLTLEIVV